MSARPRYNPQAHLEQYQYQVNAEDEVKDIDMMLDIAKTQIGDVLDKMKGIIYIIRDCGSNLYVGMGVVEMF